MSPMRLVLVALSLVASLAFAKDKAPAGKAPKQKIDLGLPSFEPVPTGEGLKKKSDAPPKSSEPSITATNATYEVVSVQHGKSFMRTPQGAKPSTPFPAVPTSGEPAVMEGFTSVVRVRSPQKADAPIEVAILDTRGDTVMEAKGNLVFRGQKETELDWTVDWAPTQLPRGAGAFQVLVRVASQPMGTFPLTVAPPAPRK